MSPRYRAPADIEELVVDYLKRDLDFSDTVHGRLIATKLPRDFSGKEALIVDLNGGNGARHLRRPLFDLNTYAPTSKRAFDVMAGALRSLADIVDADLDGAVVTEFEEVTHIIELDEPDDGWARRLCTVALTVHPRERRP
jgi:hypothetical protein